MAEKLHQEWNAKRLWNWYRSVLKNVDCRELEPSEQRRGKCAVFVEFYLDEFPLDIYDAFDSAVMNEFPEGWDNS